MYQQAEIHGVCRTKPSVALNRSMMCGSWETVGRVSPWGHRDIPSSAALLPEAASACQEDWVYTGDYCNNALTENFQDFNSLSTITSPRLHNTMRLTGQFSPGTAVLSWSCEPTAAKNACGTLWKLGKTHTDKVMMLPEYFLEKKIEGNQSEWGADQPDVGCVEDIF